MELINEDILSPAKNNYDDEADMNEEGGNMNIDDEELPDDDDDDGDGDGSGESFWQEE